MDDILLSYIGANVHIAEDAILQGGHRIGHDCVIEDGATLKWGAVLTAYTQVHSGAFLGPYSVCLGPAHPAQTVIGKGAWLGAHVLVAPGVHICAGAKVGAGTFVTEDIAEPGLYVQGPGSHLRRLK